MDYTLCIETNYTVTMAETLVHQMSVDFKALAFRSRMSLRTKTPLTSYTAMNLLYTVRWVYGRL